MKKIFFFLILIFIGTINFAQGFDVKEFHADIFLNTDGSFDVVEKYDINFTEPKHGLMRNIITKFNFIDENGKKTKKEIYISDIDVPGKKFSTNQVIFGKSIGGQLDIKIGDKDQFISGEQQYEIRYKVRNAIIFTDSLAQFYWNVKPSRWLSVFYKINFTVHAPDGAVLSPENCFVYSGPDGTTEPSKDFEYDYSGNQFTAKSPAGLFLSMSGQSVTVLMKLPKSLISGNGYQPPFLEKYGWIAIIGIIAVLSIFFMIVKGGYKKVTAITSYYPPVNMDPAMAGVLIDDSPNIRDVMCLLPYWATKGIIKMEAIEKGDRSLYNDLKLYKLKDLPEDHAGYEHNLFGKIFKSSADSVRVSNLQGIVMEPVTLLNKAAQKQFYSSSPKAVKAWGCLVALWAIGGTVGLFLVWGWKAALVNVIVSVFFSVLVFKRKKNLSGNEVFAELLGFKQFIKMADAERLKTLLKEDPTYFEKTMPYAVAFNLLKEWTGKFEGLLTSAPDWYSSSSHSGFTMSSFATSFGTSMGVANSMTMSSPSSSSSSSSSHSGGGSSGGGAGGGGGGSW